MGADTMCVINRQMTNTAGERMATSSDEEGLANGKHISACQRYIRNLAMGRAGG